MIPKTRLMRKRQILNLVSRKQAMTPSFEYKDVILEKALNSLKSVLSVTGKNKVLLSTEIVQAFEVTCPFQA